MSGWVPANVYEGMTFTQRFIQTPTSAYQFARWEDRTGVRLFVTRCESGEMVYLEEFGFDDAPESLEAWVSEVFDRAREIDAIGRQWERSGRQWHVDGGAS